MTSISTLRVLYQQLQSHSTIHFVHNIRRALFGFPGDFVISCLAFLKVSFYCSFV